MSLNPFTWIRQAARAAFVGGVADGLIEVSQGMPNPPTSLAELLEKLALPPSVATLPALADQPSRPEDAATEKPAAATANRRKAGK